MKTQVHENKNATSEKTSPPCGITMQQYQNSKYVAKYSCKNLSFGMYFIIPLTAKHPPRFGLKSRLLFSGNNLAFYMWSQINVDNENMNCILRF